MDWVEGSDERFVVMETHLSCIDGVEEGEGRRFDGDLLLVVGGVGTKEVEQKERRVVSSLEGLGLLVWGLLCGVCSVCYYFGGNRK